MIKQTNLISHQWKAARPKKESDPFLPTLDSSQKSALLTLRDATYMLLNAPTGWGKSIVMIFITVYKSLKTPSLKTIFVVPQTIIGSNFTQRGSDKTLQVRMSYRLIAWIVGMDLTGRESSKATQLINFLRSDTGNFSARLCVCTHTTVNAVYATLKESDELHLFNSVLLWVDEAHHVMNGMVQDSDETRSNTLGAMVTDLVTGGYDTQVGLATATFMRGDLRHILTDGVYDQFVRHDVPYDEYFRVRRPLEGFSFDVVLGDYKEVVTELFQQSVEPTILYLPKRGSKYATASKDTEVKSVIEGIELGTRTTATYVDGVYTFTDGARIIKALDFVTVEGRDKLKSRDLSDIDVIIALDMMKEGFDWPAAQRSIIFGERHSVPEMIQMIGRLLRKYPGKKQSRVYQVLPTFVGKGEEIRDYQNDVLTVILAAMLLEDVFLPKYFSVSGSGDETIRALANTDVWRSLMLELITVVGDLDYADAIKYMPAVFEKFDIPEHKWTEVWDFLWAKIKSRGINQSKLSVNDLDFKVLKKEQFLGVILSWTSELLGLATFEELRRVINGARRSLGEGLRVAEELTRDNFGFLPASEYLNKSGYKWLVSMRNRNKPVFAHLTQERVTWDDERFKKLTDRLDELVDDETGQLPHRGSYAFQDKDFVAAMDILKQRRPNVFNKYTFREPPTTEELVQGIEEGLLGSLKYSNHITRPEEGFCLGRRGREDGTYVKYYHETMQLLVDTPERLVHVWHDHRRAAVDYRNFEGVWKFVRLKVKVAKGHIERPLWTYASRYQAYWDSLKLSATAGACLEFCVEDCKRDDWGFHYEPIVTGEARQWEHVATKVSVDLLNDGNWLGHARDLGLILDGPVEKRTLLKLDSNPDRSPQPGFKLDAMFSTWEEIYHTTPLAKELAVRERDWSRMETNDYRLKYHGDVVPKVRRRRTLNYRTA